MTTRPSPQLSKLDTSRPQGEGLFYHDDRRPKCANPACHNEVMMGQSGRYLKYCGRDGCRKNAFYHRRQALIKQLSYDNPTTSYDNPMTQALQAQAEALAQLAQALANLPVGGGYIPSDSPSLYSGVAGKAVPEGREGGVRG